MTPPAAPTLHPKRWCNTCDFKGDRIGTSSWVCNNPECAVTDYIGKSHPFDLCCGPDDIILARVGCASHSSTPDADARQRIEDVVKELEKLKENYALHYTHKDEDDWNDDPTFGDGAVDACTKAIALLKNGVERK